jgi:hypothetical protein
MFYEDHFLCSLDATDNLLFVMSFIFLLSLYMYVMQVITTVLSGKNGLIALFGCDQFTRFYQVCYSRPETKNEGKMSKSMQCSNRLCMLHCVVILIFSSQL